MFVLVSLDSWRRLVLDSGCVSTSQVPRGGSIVVTDVDAQGPAAAFGIQPGDLITSVGILLRLE